MRNQEASQDLTQTLPETDDNHSCDFHVLLHSAQCSAIAQASLQLKHFAETPVFCIILYTSYCNNSETVSLTNSVADVRTYHCWFFPPCSNTNGVEIDEIICTHTHYLSLCHTRAHTKSSYMRIHIYLDQNKKRLKRMVQRKILNLPQEILL